MKIRDDFSVIESKNRGVILCGLFGFIKKDAKFSNSFKNFDLCNMGLIALKNKEVFSRIDAKFASIDATIDCIDDAFKQCKENRKENFCIYLYFKNSKDENQNLVFKLFYRKGWFNYYYMSKEKNVYRVIKDFEKIDL